MFAIVLPGETGSVPLGAPIDNDSPPRGLIPGLSHFDRGFDDPRTIRFNLGYEHEFRGDLAAWLDLLHARCDSLWVELRRVTSLEPVRDAFGRPVYTGQRIAPFYGPSSRCARRRHRSDYLSAHRCEFAGASAAWCSSMLRYTWSRDRSNEDKERFGSLTLTDPIGPGLRLGTLDPRHPPQLRGERRLLSSLRHHRQRHLRGPVGLSLHRTRSGGGLRQLPRLVAGGPRRRPNPSRAGRCARAGKQRAKCPLDQSRCCA